MATTTANTDRPGLHAKDCATWFVFAGGARPCSCGAITQRFIKERDGWLVETYVGAELRRQTWTAGNKRDSQRVAATDRAEVTR